MSFEIISGFEMSRNSLLDIWYTEFEDEMTFDEFLQGVRCNNEVPYEEI